MIERYAALSVFTFYLMTDDDVRWKIVRRRKNVDGVATGARAALPRAATRWRPFAAFPGKTPNRFYLLYHAAAYSDCCERS